MTTEISRSNKTAAAGLLAQGMSADAAGRELGIPGRRIRAWRQEDPGFRADIETARRALLSEAVAVLTTAVRKAADVTLELLDDPSAVIRVRAVSEVFRALPLLSEHADLSARLAAVEERLTASQEREVPRVVA